MGSSNPIVLRDVINVHPTKFAVHIPPAELAQFIDYAAGIKIWQVLQQEKCFGPRFWPRVPVTRVLRIEFIAPAIVGDILEIEGSLAKIGKRSSVDVGLDIYAVRGQKRKKIGSALARMVTVNKWTHKATPHRLPNLPVTTSTVAEIRDDRNRPGITEDSCPTLQRGAQIDGENPMGVFFGGFIAHGFQEAALVRACSLEHAMQENEFWATRVVDMEFLMPGQTWSRLDA